MQFFKYVTQQIAFKIFFAQVMKSRQCMVKKGNTTHERKNYRASLLVNNTIKRLYLQNIALICIILNIKKTRTKKICHIKLPLSALQVMLDVKY